MILNVSSKTTGLLKRLINYFYTLYLLSLGVLKKDQDLESCILCLYIICRLMRIAKILSYAGIESVALLSVWGLVSTPVTD